MLPPEVGVPVVRRELTAAGDGGEVLVARLARASCSRSATPPAASTPRPTEPSRHAGPMTGRIAALTVGGGCAVRDRARPEPPGLPQRPPHRRHPVLPGVMGIEGFAEAAAALLPGWHVTAAGGRRPAGAVQVLPRRAAHARAARAAPRRRRRDAPGRLPPGRAAHAAGPGRAGDAPLHRSRRASRASRPRRRRPGSRPARADGRPSTTTRSTASTSTAPPTRCSTARGRANGARARRGSPAICRPTTSRPSSRPSRPRG